MHALPSTASGSIPTRSVSKGPPPWRWERARETAYRFGKRRGQDDWIHRMTELEQKGTGGNRENEECMHCRPLHLIPSQPAASARDPTLALGSERNSSPPHRSPEALCPSSPPVPYGPHSEIGCDQFFSRRHKDTEIRLSDSLRLDSVKADQMGTPAGLPSSVVANLARSFEFRSYRPLSTTGLFPVRQRQEPKVHDTRHNQPHIPDQVGVDAIQGHADQRCHQHRD